MFIKSLSLARVGHRPKLGRANIESVFATKIFQLFELRNIWSNLALYSLNYATKQSDLVQYAETLRTQGARFQIAEIPAIAVSSSIDALVICTPSGTEKPFSQWQPKIRNTTISGMYQSLTRDPHLPPGVSVFRHPQEDEKINPFSLPLKEYYSLSDGIYYRLSWAQFRGLRPGRVNSYRTQRTLPNLSYLYNCISDLTHSLQSIYDKRSSFPVSER